MTAIDNVTSVAGNRMARLARDVRSIERTLAENDAAAPAVGLVHQAADLLERASQYLKSADGGRLLDDAQQLARRNPRIAAGAALVLGFGLGRFVKASRAARDGR
jgi:hypothetical protein